MPRIFDPTVGATRVKSYAIEAIELAAALADHVEKIRSWSPKSADFIEDILARLSMGTKDVFVSEAQVVWLRKLYKSTFGEDDE